MGSPKTSVKKRRERSKSFTLRTKWPVRLILIAMPLSLELLKCPRRQLTSTRAAGQREYRACHVEALRIWCVREIPNPHREGALTMSKPARKIEKPRAEYGSDVIVDMLKAFEFEYIAVNPGATFRGLHDSLVNYGGNRLPEMILCPHEEITVALAHGYARACGKPMAAAVHNIVG